MDKIRDREIVYAFRRLPGVAFELALFYFILAKRKNVRQRIAQACAKSVYWLNKAGVAVPEYLVQLSCFGQLEEIKKILVLNKAKIDAHTA